MERTVVLDFDGTLHPFSEGWIGYTPADEPPTPGAVAFVKALIDDGYIVVVSSARCDHEDGTEGILGWLAVHFPGMIAAVSNEKAPAIAYVDDRAVVYDGDWGRVRSAIDRLAARPHGAGVAEAIVVTETVDEALLRSTTVAAVWAQEFAKVRPDVDRGLMIAWFANAIEQGRAAGIASMKALDA